MGLCLSNYASIHLRDTLARPMQMRMWMGPGPAIQISVRRNSTAGIDRIPSGVM